MIIVDFGIICIGQTQCTYPDRIENIRFEAYRREADSKAMYDDWYNFDTADSLTGYWYFVWLKEEIMYEQSFFDLGSAGSPWVCAAKEWYNSIKKILEFYIEESPEHRVAVLIRGQEESNDVVHPICKIDVFMDNLLKGNIRLNELYFIEK